MKLISFDAMRTFGIPESVYMKPENAPLRLETIRKADFLLFAPYWQANMFYYGLGKPLFPSIGTYHIGHNKIEMTRMMQLLWPRNVPETCILGNCEQAHAWILERFGFPFVAKAVKESMGNGVWLIKDIRDWRRYADTQDVLYVQEYLPIDRDLRLVVIGRRVVAGYWRCSAPGGFYTNVARGGQIETGHVPEAAVALVEEMACQLDIDHAGFDIAVVDDRLYFFEFNRLFGTAGLKKLGISTGRLIYDYLNSKKAPDVDASMKKPIDPFSKAS